MCSVITIIFYFSTRGGASSQVDSVLDISQPAYGQLQKLKGTDVANDEVSAVTQATQRSWEAKPTRMLLLQARNLCAIMLILTFLSFSAFLKQILSITKK